MEKGPHKSEERVSPHKCVACSNKQTMRAGRVGGGEGGRRMQICWRKKQKLRHVRSLGDSKTNLVCLERKAAVAVHLMVCKCSCDSRKYCLKWDFFPKKLVGIAYSYAQGIFPSDMVADRPKIPRLLRSCHLSVCCHSSITCVRTPYLSAPPVRVDPPIAPAAAGFGGGGGGGDITGIPADAK